MLFINKKFDDKIKIVEENAWIIKYFIEIDL